MKARGSCSGRRDWAGAESGIQRMGEVTPSVGMGRNNVHLFPVEREDILAARSARGQSSAQDS